MKLSKPTRISKRQWFSAVAVCVLVPLLEAHPVAAQVQNVPGQVTFQAVEVADTEALGASVLDLETYGYIEDEYYVHGEAHRYRGAVPGKLDTATVIDGGHPYGTRILVRRPADEADFNGSVVVEWSNVTVGQDIDFIWAESHEHLLREGYAIVGVSAQKVGVDRLTTWSPERYGDLSVDAENVDPETGEPIDVPTSPADAGNPNPPADPLSWDIFGQIGAALAGHQQDDHPLEGLEVESLIAAGESQSAGRLTTYYNTVHPLHDVYDGFVYYDGARRLRDDLSDPAVTVGSEWRANRSMDWAEGAFLRSWEVAGTSHVSRQGMDYVDAQILRDRSLITPAGPVSLTDAISGCVYDQHWSTVDTGLVLNAAISHVNRWITGGTPAPKSSLFARTGTGALAYHAGEVVGGIRLPHFEVPIAENIAVNAGPGFCSLTGYHRFYSPGELKELYESHGRYVSKVDQAVREVASAGYVLQADARELRRQAAQSAVAR